MGSDDRNTAPGPLILRPDALCNGVAPARQMLQSDLLLQGKFAPSAPVAWQPSTSVLPMTPVQADIDEADLQALKDYLQGIDANIIVPAPTRNPHPPAEEQQDAVEDDAFWDLSIDGPSRSTEDGGTSEEWRRGVREYLSSGYTRTNPDGTHEVDNDFGGKWSDDFTLLEGSAEHEFFDVSVADGEFGESGEILTGNGRILGADADMGAGFEVTNEALKGNAHIGTAGSLAEGSIETTDEHLVSAEADGSIVSGEVKAEGEIILSPEEATLKGALGAEVNLIELSAGGDLHITPRRIVNPGIQLWNWAMEDDVEPLSENWDIGIVLGGEVSGQVGAQIGAEGEIGYSDGRATAEAGAKIGLGVGVGVKARGGLVGVDKVMDALGDAWNWATTW